MQRLRSIARDTGLLIAAGLLEDAGSLLFNTHVLAGPTGVLGTWRKMHVPLFEQLPHLVRCKRTCTFVGRRPTTCDSRLSHGTK